MTERARKGNSFAGSAAHVTARDKEDLWPAVAPLYATMVISLLLHTSQMAPQCLARPAARPPSTPFIHTRR